MRPPDAPRKSGIKPVVPCSIFSHDTPCENMCRPTFKAQRNSFQTPLGRTVVHGSMSARLDGFADEVINCAHEDGPWPDDSERQRRDCGPDPMLRETGREACRLVKFNTLGDCEGPQ